MNDRVRELLRRAQHQHGLVGPAEVAIAGATRTDLRALVRQGFLEVVGPGVYRVAGAPRAFDQALLAAVLAHGPRCCASHRSAARLWALPGYRRAMPEILVPYGANQRSDLARIRVSRRIPDRDTTSIRSIPVTTVARTLFDLAGVDHPKKVERALDDALARGLCTTRQVNQVLFAQARRGRAGTVAMRGLLADRGEGYVAPASELERRARSLFASVGLPMPAFEVDLGDGDWIGRVDCIWREARVVVELDGRRFHAQRLAREADRMRDNRLIAAGWRVLRFTWDDVVHRPEAVVSQLRAALAHR